MSVYVCTVERGLCSRVDSCMLRRSAPEDEIHVIFFKPIRSTGEACPHYLPEFENPS